MDPQPPRNRTEQVDQLFSEALDLPASERAAFVQARCAGDESLGNSVLHLLSEYGRLGDFLTTPAFLPPPLTAEFPPGEVLSGRFRIAESVGGGGMGQVYRAEDTELKETVALKVLHPRLRGEEAVAARFRDEIRLARKVSHPNVCRIFDLFVESRGADQIVYFTMEFLEGPTLAQKLAHGPVGAAEALGLARQIAAGLDAAHKIDIVHRDLKPANIILVPGSEGGSERAVITDFGLAKALETEAPSGQTQAGQIVGTPDYMAPEQFLGSDITAATDSFALGIIIFEMVAGRRPFPPENMVRTALRRINGRAELLSTHAPSAPVGWSGVLAQALAPAPESRFGSAGELVEALESGSIRAGSPRPAIPRPSRRGLLYAGAASFSVAAVCGFWRYREWEVVLPEKPLVMLTPLTYSTDSKEASVSAGTLDLLLANQLQQSSHVRLLPQDRIQSAWQRIAGSSSPMPPKLEPSTDRDIALRQGAQFVVFGNLSKVADEDILQLRLELMGADNSSARRHWKKEFPVQQPSDLPSAVYEGANWVRKTVGESAADLESRARRPEELTTSSWQALQEYTQANSAWRAGQADAALLHLKDALALDRKFAQALARMADILTSLGRPDEGLPYYAAAAEIIRQKNLTDRESLRIEGMFALDTGQRAEAETVFARYALQYPEDSSALFYQAAAVHRQGRPEEALRLLDKAIALDPNSYSYNATRADRLLDAGALDQCEEQCARTAKIRPGDWIDMLRGAIAFARGDFAQAWARLESMRTTGSPLYCSRAYGQQACFRAEQGRWEEAERLLRDGLSYDSSMGLGPEAIFTKRRLLAQASLRHGRSAEAVERCGDLLAAKPGYENTMHTGCLLAQAGDIERARTCLVQGLPAWPIYQHWELRLRGEIALAEGRSRQGFELLRDVPSGRIPNQWPEYLVRAAIAIGDHDTVRTLVAKLLQRPGSYWLQADGTGPAFFSRAVTLAGSYSLTERQASFARAFGAIGKI